MQLPYTANSLLFWMDPTEKFVTKDGSNNVSAIVNRAGWTGNNLITTNSVTSPVWTDNSVNGQPTIAFSGAQSMLFNMDDSAAPVGNKKPFMMVLVARCLVFSTPKSNIPFFMGNKYSANPAQAFFFSTQSATPTCSHQKVSNTIQAAFSAAIPPVDTGYHVFTSAYDGTSLKLRIDGVEVNNTSAVNLTTACSLNQVALGYVTPPKVATIGAFTEYFTGNIATALAYIAEYGAPLDYSIEDYLMDYYGI